MHTSACRSRTPSCQVTDPLIRAALTENTTPNTERIALLCDSVVKTQELLHLQQARAKVKNVFYFMFFSQSSRDNTFLSLSPLFSIHCGGAGCRDLKSLKTSGLFRAPCGAGGV